MFVSRKLIRFAHCDLAGIVFYPQYLVLCNETVEDWFDQALGVPLQDLINRHKRGIPMRHIDAEFVAAARCGEQLDFQLQVLRIGNSSFTLQLQATDDLAVVRFRARQTLVWADVEGPSPTAIPLEWREKFARFQLTEED